MSTITENQKERAMMFLAECEKQNMTLPDVLLKLKISGVSLTDAIDLVYEYRKLREEK